MATVIVNVGDNVLARAEVTKAWNLGSVVSQDLESNEITIRWISDDRLITLPANSDHVDILGKRKHKERVNLSDLDYELEMAIKNKKPRSSKPLKEAKVAPPSAKKLAEEKPKKSANMIDLEEVERASDRSLACFLNVLAPFISAKTHARLSATTPHPLEPTPMLTQPSSIVNVVMRDYQCAGMSFMVQHYHHKINCILADEMGLGKTLQTISYFGYLLDTLSISGPHLVVVPLSVLFNWITECKRFCPSLSVVRVHTNQKAESARIKSLIHNNEHDIYVTTYETVKTGMLKESLHRILWQTIVLDEGHRIKNEGTHITHACKTLRARFKIVLTGTPVQNNLVETHSLLNFLHPTVFDTAEPFKDCFDLSQTITVNRHVINQVHHALRPFVLRRIKTEVEQTLPPKIETMVKCPLSDMQTFWIKRLLLKEGALLAKLEQEFFEQRGETNSTSATEWKKLQSLLAQLRKAANHPYLFSGAEKLNFDDDGNLLPNCSEEIVTASGKMVMLDRLLAKLHKKGHRVVIFSQFTSMLDIISDFLEYRGYSSCRLDGSTHRVYREILINQFNKPKSQYFVFCLSTRAGGEGVNLFTADTVILFDSDWNAQVDIQAMARVHRIGQKKVVHVYRLVSEGSVEERIVQRAQKKLFLDAMVNRGSTSQALALDRLQQEQNEEDNIESSAMFSTLKFGWNAIFSGAGSASKGMSDAELDQLINRTRGIGLKEEQRSDTVSPNTTCALLENQENTVDDFEEAAPMVKLREFGGGYVARGESANTSILGIAEEWEQIKQQRRENAQRCESVRVTNVGVVSVLKSNQYTLESGEVSVYAKELKGVSAMRDVKRTVEKFENQDFCQYCWDGGKLICCSLCPASYHVRCAGLTSVPPREYKCPHHQECVNCGVSAQARSFTFRCEACPNAYCEDCLPVNAEILERCDRWIELGLRQRGNCCYIQCTPECTKTIKMYKREMRKEQKRLADQVAIE